MMGRVQHAMSDIGVTNAPRSANMVVHQAFVTKLTEVVHVTMGLLATDANYRV